MLAFWSPSPGEMLLVAVVALLLYGGELPKVARSWGKSLAEFRRGLSGIQNDLNDTFYSEPEQLEYHRDVYSRDDSYPPDSYDSQVEGHLSDSQQDQDDSEHLSEETPTSSTDDSSDLTAESSQASEEEVPEDRNA